MSEKIYVRYGDAHSKHYKKSVLSSHLVSNTKDEEGNVIHTKLYTDLHLLLREKNIHKQIGLDALRSYVESIQLTEKSMPTDLTDEQLFQLIEPRTINNLTDAYQYAKYIEAHSKEIKKRYDEVTKHAKTLRKYASNLNNDNK